MRVSLQPSYILHSRPYRDSSALLEVFTAQQGRLSLVARGSRRQSRKGNPTALLQPFNPLLLSYSGRSDLKTLVAFEAVGTSFALRGERLFSGLYLNELLIRLLHRHDGHPQLFAAYTETLRELAGVCGLDAVLRRFEITLLHELGYRLEFGVDGQSGEAVTESRSYRFEPVCGLVVTSENTATSGGVYPGAHLLQMASGDFEGEVRVSAKRLLREVLSVHLGDSPLHSRALFRAGRKAQP